jgi:hypothetical protein
MTALLPVVAATAETVIVKALSRITDFGALRYVALNNLCNILHCAQSFQHVRYVAVLPDRML